MENDNLSSKSLNILKASLPFVPLGMQRGMSYFIKIEEFNTMVRGFREDSLSGLQACGIPGSAKNEFNMQEYLSAISPYLSKSEQDLIKTMQNVVQAMKMMNTYKELDPSILSSMGNFASDPSFAQNISSMMSVFFSGNNAPNTQNTSSSENSINRENDFNKEYNFNQENNFNKEYNFNQENIDKSNIFDRPEPEKNIEPNPFTQNENQGINIESLKSMLSPSQKAMFETYSSLLNGNTAV